MPNQDPIPPGASANPSRWSHRLPLAAIAAVGFLVAFYLGLVQLGVFRSAWDPFFTRAVDGYANGSDRILHSWVSKVIPVPDAMVGAGYYLTDIALLLVGGTARWRDRPWVPVLLGLLALAGAGGSVLLVIAQPTLFGAWCTLCLTSAACSLLIVIPACQEAAAAVSELRRRRGLGASWTASLAGPGWETME